MIENIDKLEWNSENKRLALNEGLTAFNKLWKAIPEWPHFTIYHLMQQGLACLKTCLEDEQQEVSWDSPIVEMIFPIHDYSKDCLEAEKGGLTDERKKALSSFQNLFVLQAITQDAKSRKDKNNREVHEAFSFGVDPAAEASREKSILNGVAGSILDKFKDLSTIKIKKQRSGMDFSATVGLLVYPQVLDPDEKSVYFPVQVMLIIEGESPGSWSDEERQGLWADLHNAVRERIDDTLQKAVQPITPERFCSPPPERRNPFPVPRDGAKYSIGIALQRGLSQMFSEDSKVPDLSLTGEIAIQRAEKLFWEALGEVLNKMVPGWSKACKNIVIPEKDVNEAEKIWAAVMKKVGNKGPGIDVTEPRFNYCGTYENGRAIKETHIEITSTGIRGPAVRFKSQRSAGYQALLDQYKNQPVKIDDWVWIARGEELEGLTLKTASDDLKEASLYETGLDLCMAILEAFHYQKNAWVEEILMLPEGRKIHTRPWRIIVLDPKILRSRLDPGNSWGKNWRYGLFQRLKALCSLQRQVRTKTGKIVDTGDRFLERVIDGQRTCSPEQKSAPDLTGLLMREKAIPMDAFFVQVSYDFMTRLYTWAQDEKGKVCWGTEAAKAGACRILTENPRANKKAQLVKKEKRTEAQKRPYYDHSPRLEMLSNKEEWPFPRKRLAYTLLQEKTPNRNEKRHKKKNRLGGKQALKDFGGKDYILCGGSVGQGYKVDTWITKAYYGEKTRTNLYRIFSDDLAALTESLDLQLALRTGKPRRDLSNQKALEEITIMGERAGEYNLKLYLPVDLEDSLEARLNDMGIGSEEPGIIPEDIKRARTRAGFNQVELGRKIGVSQKQVSEWESGKAPIPEERQAQIREFLGHHLEP